MIFSSAATSRSASDAYTRLADGASKIRWSAIRPDHRRRKVASSDRLASITVEAVLLGPLEARSNLVFGFLNAGPGGTLDRLSGLEILVDRKEMLDLEQHELAYVGEIPDVVTSRIGRRHTQHLVVAARLVLHPEHRDCPAPNQAARERRLA